jgi:Subtilase family
MADILAPLAQKPSMTKDLLKSVFVFLPTFLTCWLAAASDLPPNLDNGLRQLYDAEQPGRPTAAISVPQPIALQRKGIRDEQGRVQVNFHLNGASPLAEVRDRITAAGGNVIAESDKYRHGILSAFVPVSKLPELARSPGVLSLSMGRRPLRNVGATTSGGAFLLRTPALNAQGLNGTGITVGVLSDSFDTATMDSNGGPLTDHAAQDVATGDLPGPGNPNNPNPVVVLEDYHPGPNDTPGFDEGRAMLQIVFDIAPQAKLAFATAFVSLVDFANNIRRLRTDANCDVITDDVIYTEEPFFSDGILAQAVNDVVFSSSLAGHKCAYFSAAGNQQGGGYTSDFNPISDAAARAGLPGQNLKLNQVPAALTSGGFHNFNSDLGGPPDITQTFPVPAGTMLEIDLQWNDPFDQVNGVTTDYNLLIFDAAGNYLAQFSGTANNFATQEAIEDITIDNPGATDANFQIAITRAGTSPTTPVARKLRYLAMDDSGDGVGALEHYQPDAPSTFGHSCALGAFGVAAYVYDDDPSNPPGPPFTPMVEDFTSPGPSTIDFDASGNRLAQPQVRQKPDIAAPDGGNTTFFGFDYEGDGFPNFFGTSAAAPHAAGVAALLLQKAGGPASLTLQQMKTALVASVFRLHDTDPFFSQARLALGPRRKSKHRRRGGPISVRITASGNSNEASATDPNFFTITLAGRANLRQLIIDVGHAGLKFDTTTATGFPFTLGRLVNISPASITTNARPGVASFTHLVINFAPGSFTPASSVSFGIDRDFIGDDGGNQADVLAGAEVNAITSQRRLHGTFRNRFGSGYTIVDGFGLIDAVLAAQAVP